MKRSVEVLEPPWQHLEAKYRVLSAHLLWHGQRSFGQDLKKYEKGGVNLVKKPAPAGAK